MTLDQYLRNLLENDEGQWFDLAAKVKLVDGQLIVCDLEAGAGKAPVGEPSQKALRGGTRVFWSHTVEL